MRTRYLAVVALSFVGTLAVRAASTTNSWTGTAANAKWETAGNWSVGAPSINDADDLLTNSALPAFLSKIVTIDSTTSGTFPGTMTINNLVISRIPATATNELFLSNTGPNQLQILNGATISDGGSLVVSNATLNIGAVVTIGGTNQAGVTVLADSSVTDNSEFYVGCCNGEQGTLNIAGGTNTFYGMAVGYSNSVGAVWVTGGQLIVTDQVNRIAIGGFGVLSGKAQMTVSNGTVLAHEIEIGQEGTLTLSGGMLTVMGADAFGYSFAVFGTPTVTGAVWVTGGQLVVTNQLTSIDISGFGGEAQMTVSNGTVLALSVYVSSTNSFEEGTLTIAGGTTIISSNLVVGNFIGCVGCGNDSGFVSVSGGSLAVTNAAHTGDMEIRHGVLTMMGGSSVFDLLDINPFPASQQSTGTVWLTGGQLSVTNNNIYVGDGGVAQMTVSNGTMLATNVYVGFNSGANGTLTVAGGYNQVYQYLIAGESAQATGTVTITDGAEVDVTNIVGATTVLGDQGVGYMNLLNGATLLTCNYIVGASGGSGFPNISGGNLLVNTCSLIDIRKGTFTLNSGSVITHNLIMTNVNGHFAFNGGLLSTQNASISNTQVFSLSSNGMYQATGGVQSFANGLLIQTNATLDGSGTIAGNVNVQGNILADAGATLTFRGGIVTNNGIIRVLSGSVLEAYSSVVNNATIILSGGTTNFHSTFVNNGVILTSGTNSWNHSSGKWETSGNWSLGVAPTNTDPADLITNAGNNTVTIDATTAGSFPATMTISNLNVSAPLNSTNTLFLNNAGVTSPLTVFNGVTVNSGGILEMANSLLLIDGQPRGALYVDGYASLNSGSIVVTNNGDGGCIIGATGKGSMNILGGSTLFDAADVGLEGTGSLTINGGTNTFLYGLVAGFFANSTGTVWVTGGLTITTNQFDSTVLGYDGVGQMIISNGTYVANSVALGGQPLSQGSLTMQGGTLISGDDVFIGAAATSTGTVWFSGGQLINTNPSSTGDLVVGYAGHGLLAVSNGTIITDQLLATNGANSVVTFTGGTITTSATRFSTGQAFKFGGGGSAPSTLNLAKGTHVFQDGLIIGDCGLNLTGDVVMTSGTLYVTNATHTATLEVRSGTFTMIDGLVVADRLVMTNACGRFLRYGGATTIGSMTLDPNLSAVGDGIPNNWKLQYGLDPLDPNLANEDADGDGFSNLQEYQAGTDPTNRNSSPFRITAITRQTNDVLITWRTAGGKTNMVQVGPGTANGSYTNNFSNLSPMVALPGSGLISTNYLDVGGATNKPSRFYRVKMMVSQAADDASDPSYSGGWTNSGDGGIGFSPWTLTTTSTDGSHNGFFIGSSTNNAFGTSPGIDVGGKSWGIYANGGNFATAYRSFANGTLLIGQSFLISMDNGFVDGGQTDGWVLRTGNASSSPSDYNVDARFEFLYIGNDASNSYKVVDAGGLKNIGMGFTGTGLRQVFLLTGANSYTLLTVNNATGTTNTFSGTLAGSGSVESLAIYNRNAGSTSTNDCFFNSLEITVP